MTRKTRQIILVSTIIFFILAVPLVLFYSWGYSFDLEKNKLVLTGGIYFESYPEKANIYLDNEKKGETDAFIKRLIPKEYQVKIEKEGFHPWHKKLKIESGMVTEAKDILLISKEINFEEVQEFPNKKQDEIFYIQKPSYILYKTDKNNSFREQISSTPLAKQEYQIFVSENKKIALLGENEDLYLLNENKFELIDKNIKEVQFSSDNQKLLYLTSSEILVYHLSNNDKELITRLSQEIEEAIWYEKTNQHIIFLVNNQMKIVELDGRDERNIINILNGEIKDITYNPEDKKIYFREEDKIKRMSLEE